MLISFSVENWRSFRNKTDFSMVARREGWFFQRVPRIEKYKSGFVPVSSVYGGNASGKTNFVLALSFLRNLVIQIQQPDAEIAVEPYCMDQSFIDKPSRFLIQFSIKDEVYQYRVDVDRYKIYTEELILMKKTSD